MIVSHGSPAVLIEGKGKAQDFPLMIHQRERLPELVFLYESVNESDRGNDAHGFMLLSQTRSDYIRRP